MNFKSEKILVKYKFLNKDLSNHFYFQTYVISLS